MTARPIAAPYRAVQGERRVPEPERPPAGAVPFDLAARRRLTERAEALGGGPATHFIQGEAGELLSGGVQVRHPSAEVDGEEPARERRDDRLVKGGDLGERALLGREPLAGGAELLGEIRRQDRDRDERGRVDEERRARHVRPVGIQAQRHEEVRGDREGGGHERAAPEEQDAAVDDADREEDDEHRRGIARDRHDRAGDEHVQHHLGVRERDERAAAAERDHGGDRDEVGRGDHRVQRQEVPLDVGAELDVHEHGAPEEHRDHHHAEERQPAELAGEPVARGRRRAHGGLGGGGDRGHGRYLMLPAMLKIGRYIAMRKPPTTPPRKTIMIGSIIDVSAATAASTSSS